METSLITIFSSAASFGALIYLVNIGRWTGRVDEKLNRLEVDVKKIKDRI